MRLLYKAGPMESLRKWFYKPKRDDRSLLAQFFFADDALNMVAAELDSFDGRKDPDRCTTLVNQLRHAQDRVLNITSQIMDQVLGDERVARGFRVKFPEDVLQDNLAGQLWFGAECLAAGSSIMNREEESAAMRPLAKALTRSLETVRSLLREQCLRPKNVALSQHDDMLHETLRIFDRLFAEFELCYVSAMVNVKTPHEFEAQQLICVLFSESLRRALKQGLLTQEQVDSYDPALMFAVPRLAIVSGLLFYSNGPLGIDRSAEEMSDMFRPFRTLLHKIKSLLYTLERRELMALERLLCSNEQVCSVTATKLANETSNIVLDNDYPDIGEFVNKFYADHVHCRDLYSQPSAIDQTITESDYLPDNIEVMTPILDGMRRLSELDNQAAPEFASHTSTDTASTETFQDKDRLEIKPRPETDLSGLRNLSTSGLMMFDPLVINAVSSENRQLPDNDLVTSLNEQVTEIADRLSSIVHSDVDSIEHSMHSYSASDVPTVVEDLVSYAGPRNEQLACLPSTSHGFLIPNAISHEPVVLASLSHNNSTVFNPEDEINEGLDLPQIIPDNIDTEIVNTNISIANANLTSLLLTNEEYRNRFVERDSECDDDSFHSSKDITVVANKDDEEKVKFLLGYESEQESQVDSGVSTENTSLDRSPDADTSKEHFMKQNRVLKTPIAEENKPENILENSFSECTDTNENCEVTVNINYVEQVEVDRNEAGSSNLVGDAIRNDLDSSVLDVIRNLDDFRNLDFTSNIDDSRVNLDGNRVILDSSRINEDDLETSRNVFQARTEASNKILREFNRHKIDRIRKVLSKSEPNGVKRDLKRENSDRGEPNSENWEPTRHNGDIIQANSEQGEPTRHNGEKRESNSANMEPNSEKGEPNSENREPTRENGDSSSSSGRQKKSGKSGSKSKRKRNKMWSPGIVLLDRAVQSQHNTVKLNLDHYVESSSTLSECADDEQIAIALQAQELAARQQARGKFKSSEDLIHRLFVCIAGVADQLQTNFAADLRNILKSVFLMNQTPDKEDSDDEPVTEPVKESVPVPVPVLGADENEEAIEYEVSEDQIIQNGSSFDSVYSAEEAYADSNSNSSRSSQCEQARIRCNTHNDTRDAEAPTTSETRRRKSIDSPRDVSDQPTSVERLPEWIPDIAAPQCMRCAAHFTAFRRRHHCRNCGKVFCASCSSNSIPLPRYGQMKPVRVCEECFRSIAKSCRRAVSGR